MPIARINPEDSDQMSSPRTHLKKDVEELLQQSVVAEAQWKALAQLDVALSTLDATERALLEGHFDGQTAAQLAVAHGMTEDQAKECLARVKRALIQALKSRIQVRH